MIKVRSRRPGKAELPPETAEVLLDTVRREMLSAIEWKLASAGKSQGASGTPTVQAVLKLPDENHGINLYEEVRQYEIQLIGWALQQAHGKQVTAARLLGIRATTLNNKIKQYDIAWKEGQ